MSGQVEDSGKAKFRPCTAFSDAHWFDSDDDVTDDEVNDPEGHAPRPDLRAEALSVEHLLTHTPKNPYCPSCIRAKMSRKPARRVRRDPETLPGKFGELVNIDHIVAHSPEAMGLTGERDALVIVDRYSGYIECYPLESKTADDAHGALVDFFGTDRPVDVYIWSDSAHELIKAVGSLKVSHGKATPGRHQANGYCERVVRKVV